MRPHQVTPYSVWNFNIPIESDNRHNIGGAAYDAKADRISVSQLRGEAKPPVIHVFCIDRGEFSFVPGHSDAKN